MWIIYILVFMRELCIFQFCAWAWRSFLTKLITQSCVRVFSLWVPGMQAVWLMSICESRPDISSPLNSLSLFLVLVSDQKVSTSTQLSHREEKNRERKLEKRLGRMRKCTCEREINSASIYLSLLVWFMWMGSQKNGNNVHSQLEMINVSSWVCIF